MGVLDFLGGLASGATSLWNNERNIQLTRDTNAQNEALMREAWAREDTAVQRRTKDLEAAGLNPLLAAGSAASSSAAMRLEAPQVRENPVQAGLIAMNAQADLQAKRAAIARTEAETRNLDLDARLKAGTTDSKIELAKVEAQRATQTLASSVSINESEAKIKAAEADKAAAYYWARADQMVDQATITKYKALADSMIATGPGPDGKWTWKGQQPATIGQMQVLAELNKAQSDAIFAAAAAGLKQLDVKAWEAIGVSSSVGQPVLNAAIALLRTLLGGK